MVVAPSPRSCVGCSLALTWEDAAEDDEVVAGADKDGDENEDENEAGLVEEEDGAFPGRPGTET